MFELNADKIRIYKNPNAFEGMRAAGQLAARVLDMITEHVKPGVSTAHLDQLCHEFILDHRAIPAPLNYNGFPKATCISLNEVICHGIPDEKRILKPTDLLNIDVTVILDGWYGDSSRMYLAEKLPFSRAGELIDITYDCLMKGIDVVRPGAYVGDIGAVISEHAEKHGFSVVTDFCGHGLGEAFHTNPSILHKGKKGTGPRLETGMFFTIEPMINIGTEKTKLLSDGWTAITKDRKLSAQFEHSLAVTDEGFEIFTLSPKGFTSPPYGT